MLSHGKLAIGCALLGFLSFESGAEAAPAYRVSGAPESVKVGDTFVVEIVLDLDGIDSLGHGVSVSFTAGLLETSLADVQEIGVPPYLGHLNPGPGLVDNESGEIRSIEAITFRPGISAAAPFTVATIQFTAIGQGTATIMPFFSRDGVLDDNAQQVPGVTFSGATITVAPDTGAPEAGERRPRGSWFRCAGAGPAEPGP